MVKYDIDYKLNIAPEFILEEPRCKCQVCGCVMNCYTDLCNRCYNE